MIAESKIHMQVNSDLALKSKKLNKEEATQSTRKRVRLTLLAASHSISITSTLPTVRQKMAVQAIRITFPRKHQTQGLKIPIVTCKSLRQLRRRSSFSINTLKSLKTDFQALSTQINGLFTRPTLEKLKQRRLKRYTLPKSVKLLVYELESIRL